jgi:hypothetical protein
VQLWLPEAVESSGERDVEEGWSTGVMLQLDKWKKFLCAQSVDYKYKLCIVHFKIRKDFESFYHKEMINVKGGSLTWLKN